MVGRVVALFFVGGGTLGLATLPFAPQDSDVAASAIFAAPAIVAGWVVWAVPSSGVPLVSPQLIREPGDRARREEDEAVQANSGAVRLVRREGSLPSVREAERALAWVLAGA